MIKQLIKHYLKNLSSFKNWRFFSNVYFKGKGKVLIAKNATISDFTIIHSDTRSKVVIREKTWVGKNCELHATEEKCIIIEQNCTINDGVKILGNIHVHKNTLIAPYVFISSDSHEYKNEPFTPIKEQDSKFKANNETLIIEEDTWIGAHSTVGNKAYLARGVILGANSFLNSQTKPYEIWGGVPAKKIGERAKFKPPKEIINEKFSPYFYRGFTNNVCESKGVILLEPKDIFEIEIITNIISRVQIFSDVNSSLTHYDLRPGSSKIVYEIQGEKELGTQIKLYISSDNPFKIFKIS